MSRDARIGEPTLQVTPRLELANVTKSYKTGAGEVHALRGIDIAIETNEFVAIMGVSGSGKSTLLHIIGCLETVSGGDYVIDGKQVADISNDARAVLRNSNFGFVFQDFNLIPDLSAEQNISLPSRYCDMPPRLGSRRAVSLLGSFDLSDRSAHFPHELSGGQQQRVAIARALINGANILLADEPTASLDSEMTADIISTLVQLHASNRTIIVSTHDPAVAAYATRVLTLKDGLVVGDRRQKPAATGSSKPDLFHDVADGQFSSCQFSRIKENVSSSIHQLRANTLRTLLTIAGVIVGASALIIVTSVSQGQTDAILSRITRLGADILFVVPLTLSQDQGGGRSTLSQDDVEAVSNLPEVLRVASETSGISVYRYGNVDRSIRTIAATPSYFPLKRWKTAYGTVFTESDVRQLQPVAVFGQNAARELFGTEEVAIGKYIVANDILLQVIGVLQSKSDGSNLDEQDNVVIVPISTGQRRLLGRTDIDVINVQLTSANAQKHAQVLIEQELSKNRFLPNFNVHNMSEIVSTASNIRKSLAFLLASIASLSLITGGVGIMNVMLMSVMERKKEIGIRLACGAQTRDIRALFITEAFVLSLVGAMIGCILGIGISFFLNLSGFPSRLTIIPIVGASVFSVTLGLVFGYLPANRAARLDPLIALGRS